MAVRIVQPARFSPFNDSAEVVLAVDDTRCGVCGRRRAGIGSSEDLARASLAKIGPCHHGRWYLKAWQCVARWWRR